MKAIEVNSMKVFTWPIGENPDIPKLLEAVDRCEGDVFFLSQDGDVLNLKSQLSKYLFAVLSSTDAAWLRGRLGVKLASDEAKLIAFISKEE